MPKIFLRVLMTLVGLGLAHCGGGGGGADSTPMASGSALSFSPKALVTMSAANYASTIGLGLTVEAWIRIDDQGTSEVARLIVMGEGGAAPGYAWRLYVAGGGLLAAEVLTGPTTGATALVPPGPTSALPLGTWMHIAFTYNGVGIRLFVNGAEVASVPLGGSVAPFTGIRIGASPYGGSSGQAGAVLIDEVRIWKGALPPPSMSLVYDQADVATGPATSLVGQWRFEAGDGVVCLDWTVNENDGKLGGAQMVPAGDPNGIYPVWVPGGAPVVPGK